MGIREANVPMVCQQLRVVLLIDSIFDLTFWWIYNGIDFVANESDSAEHESIRTIFDISMTIRGHFSRARSGWPKNELNA